MSATARDRLRRARRGAFVVGLTAFAAAAATERVEATSFEVALLAFVVCVTVLVVETLLALGRSVVLEALGAGAALAGVVVIVSGGVDGALVAALVADAALIVGVRVWWLEPDRLAARAAARLDHDPAEAERLLARAVELRPQERTSRALLRRLRRADAPLPTAPGALEERLHATLEPGAGGPRPRGTVRALLRGLLAEAAGAGLLLGPLAGLLALTVRGPREAWLAGHAVAGALVLWALPVVVAARLAARLSRPARALTVGLGLVAVALLVAVGAAYVGEVVASGPSGDAGATLQATLTSVGRRLGRGSGLTLAFWSTALLAPAIAWAGLVAHTGRGVGGWKGEVPERRLLPGALGQPWFAAVLLVFLIDLGVLAGAAFVGRWASAGLTGLLVPVAGLHAALAALVFGGMALTAPPASAGLRRGTSDERRRLVRALVAARERATAPPT